MIIMMLRCLAILSSQNLLISVLRVLLAVSDSLVDPLQKTVNFRPKQDAVKQEVDRNEDMIRSALRAILSLNRIRWEYYNLHGPYPPDCNFGMYIPSPRNQAFPPAKTIKAFPRTLLWPYGEDPQLQKVLLVLLLGLSYCFSSFLWGFYLGPPQFTHTNYNPIRIQDRRKSVSRCF